MRIVVAMSGGVDSSVAAGLLVEQGHEVIGLAMKTHDLEPRQNRACCTPDDMRDARRVADQLDIKFYVLRYAELFTELVVRPFADAYRNGRTPNPCVVCNDKVKFRPMLERAQLLGADKLATGHYARITERDGRPALERGVDAHKDQSYFLYRLIPEQLASLMFPLGGMTKAQVREHARRLGLPTADKHESQEICFVGAEGYAATVESLGGGGRAGAIVDEEGRELGRHAGVHHFTLGQRRGLGISAPQPLYVTHIDAARGEVRVGRRDALMAAGVRLRDLSWTASPPRAGERLSIQQRYRQQAMPVVVTHCEGGVLEVLFEAPEVRGSPGQAAVLYRGDVVVGGGTIARPLPMDRGVAPEMLRIA